MMCESRCQDHIDENIRLENALKEIIELVKTHNKELALDCEKILDKYSWT